MSRYHVRITITHTIEIEAEGARAALHEGRQAHEKLRYNKDYNAPEASTVDVVIFNKNEEWPDN